MAGSPADILRGAGVPFEEQEVPALGTLLRVSASDIVAALGALSAGGYDQLVDLFGTDRDEAVEVTYHVRVLAEMRDAYLRLTLPYDGELPSVWEVYPAALYPEREAAELLGFSLSGHPNPKRLLTSEGVPPFLRKSVLPRDAGEVRYTP